MCQRAFNNVVEPISFSTFHLLRTCNRLMLPLADTQSYYKLTKDNSTNHNAIVNRRPDNNCTPPIISSQSPAESPLLDVIETMPSSLESSEMEMNLNKSDDPDLNDKNQNAPLLTPSESDTGSIANDVSINNAFYRTGNGQFPIVMPNFNMLPLTDSNSTLNSSKSATLPAFEYIAPTSQHHPHHHHHHHSNNHPHHHTLNTGDFPLMELNRVGVFPPSFMHRRPRGEKRPIPDEQKDEKYYERRKRNNEAAKKSRDARKIREDRIAFRAALLEQENSILRAQVLALRDELQTMRQLINTSSAASIVNRSGTQI